MDTSHIRVPSSHAQPQPNTPLLNSAISVEQKPQSAALSTAPTRRRTEKAGGNEILPFPEVATYGQEIDPASLLDEISNCIRRHIVLSEHQAHAAALWCAMTWVTDVIQTAPLLLITAPERACGKSQLLNVLGMITCRPISTANATASFIFRGITHWHPTLLVDEADTFLGRNNELSGLINAGHTRSQAFVGRVLTSGDTHTPVCYDVWCAKAFAGIALDRHLPDATVSRGIKISLRRKKPTEAIERFRHAAQDSFTVLAEKLARFAQDYSDKIAEARPELPDALSDRTQDNWEPLFAIASCAGDEWVKKATEAALTLSNMEKEAVCTSNELLADIHDVFQTKGCERIRSADLISALIDISEGAWSTFNNGRPISPRQLSKFLGEYGISSKTVRFGNETPKGYERSQFTDAFSRYLDRPDAQTPQETATSQPLQCNGFMSVADVSHPPPTLFRTANNRPESAF